MARSLLRYKAALLIVRALFEPLGRDILADQEHLWIVVTGYVPADLAQALEYLNFERTAVGSWQWKG